MGGLLVLFIYICLVRRNFPLKVRFEGLVVAATMSLICSFIKRWSQPLFFLGQGSWNSGVSLVEGRNISIFLFLVVLLLAMLLVVVRVSGVGSALVVNEKT